MSSSSRSSRTWAASWRERHTGEVGDKSGNKGDEGRVVFSHISDLGDSLLSIFTQNSIENKSIDTNNPLAFHINSKAIKAKALLPCTF